MIAAQVAGNVVEIRVRAGDRVSAGQLLLRIDGMAAEQAAAAARNEYARQRGAVPQKLHQQSRAGAGESTTGGNHGAIGLFQHQSAVFRRGDRGEREIR